MSKFTQNDALLRACTIAKSVTPNPTWNLPTNIPHYIPMRRLRAIGTLLWFMRGIPPRSALSYIMMYRALIRR